MVTRGAGRAIFPVDGLIVLGRIAPLTIDLEAKRRAWGKRALCGLCCRTVLVRQQRLCVSARVGQDLAGFVIALGVPVHRGDVALGMIGSKLAHEHWLGLVGVLPVG